MRGSGIHDDAHWLKTEDEIRATRNGFHFSVRLSGLEVALFTE